MLANKKKAADYIHAVKKVSAWLSLLKAFELLLLHFTVLVLIFTFIRIFFFLSPVQIKLSFH